MYVQCIVHIICAFLDWFENIEKSSLMTILIKFIGLKTEILQKIYTKILIIIIKWKIEPLPQFCL